MQTASGRLLLFDIDQTLIFTAGAGMRCMARAIVEVTGTSLDGIQVHPDGKTDPAILHEILSTCGRPSASIESEIWSRYARHLQEELSCTDDRRCMKPGVAALLGALQQDGRAHLGLLTGNLETTARIKLAAFDLNRYFPIGAFGSDSAERTALGPVALRRAEAHWGCAFPSSAIWVIGDTTLDVLAAHAFGARALGVATGRTSIETLRHSGADAVRPDLSQTEDVFRLLLD